FIYWWYNKSTTLGANPKGGSPFTQNFSRLVVKKNSKRTLKPT
ncbi:hypothetical protein M2480_001436, partial [Parabacteroides sp. PFB2-12]|nr:hypothetical protein [Parabacteroides sp. PM6-13]MDH6390461.1 hypothetical protein [Parabacteroides sp. PFB2-12]